MSKERYQFFEIKNAESVKNLEKLAKQGQIEKAYPLTDIKSIMHLYKTEGFNIASYFYENEARIEFSRYENNEMKMAEKISQIKEMTGMEFKEK